MRRLKSCSSVFVFIFFCVGISISYAADTLRVGESMKDSESLESSNKIFQLVFFSYDSLDQRYLGIQHMQIPDKHNYGTRRMVWVANRNDPLSSSYTNSNLTITEDGNLVINDDYGISITLNSGHPAKSSANTSVTLLDSGNLVFRDGETTVWQSFDYPSHTWLPGMKLGLFDLNDTGKPPRQQFLTSWVSPQVPTLGAFTLGIVPNNTKQLVVWQRGVLHWNSGTWNGHNFTYFPGWKNQLYFQFIRLSFISNERESYFTYSSTSNNISTLIGMDSFGKIYISRGGLTQGYILPCDASLVEERDKGCITAEPSKCRSGDVFYETTGSISQGVYLLNYSLGQSDCKEICRRNCSCNAYASARSSDSSGCLFSYGKFQYVTGSDSLFQRDSTTVEEGINTPPGHSRKRKLWLIIGGPCASLLVLAALSVFCYLRYGNWLFIGTKMNGINKRTQQLTDAQNFNIKGATNDLSDAQKQGLIGKDHELPLFSFHSIQFATDQFSDANKIGQGGFGPVYKGKLVGGLEIAVKRLSKSSGQGMEEFKNEVVLISKLQHRNLVRLLGCCTHGDERILVYEYLQNKSLDCFLFDATKRALLDWKLRVCIIEGIAQGLLYLHKYSRLRIIHRDLKTSNVLLDNNMNPKISDFGTARIFGENESRANTSRIVGTYGYMSPEYAMDGLFSEKSDVFSFGVMMLEIISGKKNTGFYQPDRCLNLLGYAWDLWKKGRGVELIEQELVETYPTSEVSLRYVQVGLLCVQESAADRPIMLNVVSMLSNEMMVLPAPKNPAFSASVCTVNYSDPPQAPEPCSKNEVTISELQAR